MKLSHVLEARAASKYKDEEHTLAGKPRLQREGDFVWHLYKFFEVDEEHSEVRSKKNPAFRKALRQIATEAVKEWQAKYSKKYPKWKQINVNKAVTNIIEGIYHHTVGQHPEEWFDPFDANAEYGWDNQQDWQRDYDEEVARYERENKTRGWNLAQHAGGEIEAHWGKKGPHSWSKVTGVPAPIKKQVKALVQEVYNRIIRNHDDLPPKEFPGKSILVYDVKDGLKAFMQDKEDDDNWHHITGIKVVLDPKGNVTQSSAYTGHYAGGFYEGRLITRKIHAWSVADLREHIKYFKEDADW